MSRHDWQAIKASVNVAALIGKAVKLRKSGNLHEGCCPFHAEKTPSFKVYADGYHCFGCGAHGDAVDFIVAMENCTPAEAIAKLGGDITITGDAARRVMSDREAQQQAERDQAIATARRRWDSAEPAPDHHPYLAAKHIKPYMARVENGWLLLPVHGRDGEVQSVQRIAASQDENRKWPKIFQKAAPMKGGRLNLGINLGRSIVCEGFATGASIYDAIPDRVCIAFSAAGVIDIVRELHGAGMAVAIASDRSAASKMLALGAELGVPVFLPQDPYDDFNDMAVALGENAVEAVFKAPPAIPLPDDGTAPQTPLSPTDGQNEGQPANDDGAPVDVWARYEPPALMSGVLPEIIERFARTRARMLGGDPGGIAMASIVACAAVITDRIRLKVKRHEDWHESARLWAMLIGNPSTKKSSLMRAACRKISSMDSQMLRDYDKAFADWKDGGEHGEMPIPTRLRIEDTTMEAAQEVCRNSPDGILALQDELSGWFGGIEKYAGGKGSAKDRSFWLQAYGGGEYAVNRISRKSFLIDNLSISIIGGIQPDAIRRVMVDATDDGLIQRFMPVILAPATIGVDEEMPDVAFEYDELIARLRHMHPPSGVFGDIALTFDNDAMQIRAGLEVKHHEMAVSIETVNKKLGSHLGKYDGLFPRMCIVWHCIENANKDALPTVITGATAARVASFLHGYVLKHAMAFYTGIIGLSEDQDIIEDIAGYILAHEVTTLTARTFSRGSTRMRKLTKFQIEPICQQLEAFGWLESINARGETFTAKVNPSVHTAYRARAESERTRRQTVAEQMRNSFDGKSGDLGDQNGGDEGIKTAKAEGGR